MAKKNKLWFSGEDAQLAARFTKFMTKVLYARRASYIRALMVKAKREVSIEECRDEVDTVYRRLMNPIEEKRRVQADVGRNQKVPAQADAERVRGYDFLICRSSFRAGDRSQVEGR